MHIIHLQDGIAKLSVDPIHLQYATNDSSPHLADTSLDSLKRHLLVNVFGSHDDMWLCVNLVIKARARQDRIDKKDLHHTNENLGVQGKRLAGNTCIGQDGKGETNTIYEMIGTNHTHEHEKQSQGIVCVLVNDMDHGVIEHLRILQKQKRHDSCTKDMSQDARSENVSSDSMSFSVHGSSWLEAAFFLVCSFARTLDLMTLPDHDSVTSQV